MGADLPLFKAKDVSRYYQVFKKENLDGIKDNLVVDLPVSINAICHYILSDLNQEKRME